LNLRLFINIYKLHDAWSVEYWLTHEFRIAVPGYEFEVRVDMCRDTNSASIFKSQYITMHHVIYLCNRRSSDKFKCWFTKCSWWNGKNVTESRLYRSHGQHAACIDVNFRFSYSACVESRCSYKCSNRCSYIHTWPTIAGAILQVSLCCPGLQNVCIRTMTPSWRSRRWRQLIRKHSTSQYNRQRRKLVKYIGGGQFPSLPLLMKQSILFCCCCVGVLPFSCFIIVNTT